LKGPARKLGVPVQPALLPGAARSPDTECPCAAARGHTPPFRAPSFLSGSAGNVIFLFLSPECSHDMPAALPGLSAGPSRSARLLCALLPLMLLCAPGFAVNSATILVHHPATDAMNEAGLPNVQSTLLVGDFPPFCTKAAFAGDIFVLPSKEVGSICYQEAAQGAVAGLRRCTIDLSSALC
jgi:hypothetical protein